MASDNKIVNKFVQIKSDLQLKKQHHDILYSSFRGETNHANFSVIDEDAKISIPFLGNFEGLIDTFSMKIYLDGKVKFKENLVIKDKNKTPYYIKYINPIPHKYEKSIDGVRECIELTEIEYILEKPQAPINVVNNYTDNSVTIKNNKGIIDSPNSSLEKTSNVNVDTNIEVGRSHGLFHKK